MNVQDFLQTSYTPYHAVENCRAMLDKAGFRAMREDAIPSLQAGDRGYVIQDGTGLFAFVVGDDPTLMLTECHTDSPCLRVKGPRTLPSAEGRRINVEKYGGLLLYSMLDIPLRVAGRLTVETADGVQTRTVVSDRRVVIPSLCIHHNPAHNELTLNVQSDMLPLVGDVEDVYQWLCDAHTVLDADLYVVSDVAPYAAGADEEYLCAPRIDDLAAVFACIEALCDCHPQGLAMVACYNNEEIGSGTKQGAASIFMHDLVQRILTAAGAENPTAAIRKGMALSVDNGHAEHPAHPEKSDVQGGPRIGGGVVVKHHVNYATDGLSAGIFKHILGKADIPCQDYYNRSDIGCGSTLGNIAARWLAIDTVDIGLAQLAMHSAVETMGIRDLGYLTQGVQAFLNSKLIRTDDGIRIQ